MGTLILFSAVIRISTKDTVSDFVYLICPGLKNKP